MFQFQLNFHYIVHLRHLALGCYRAWYVASHLRYRLRYIESTETKRSKLRCDLQDINHRFVVKGSRPLCYCNLDMLPVC